MAWCWCSYDKHTLESFVFCPNIDEPFEWTRKSGGPEDVYFKTQNPYTYTQAKDYCNRQGDSNSTGVGIHSSQLWMLFENGTLKNKQNIWKSKKNVRWNIVRKPSNPKACPGFPIPAPPGVSCVTLSGTVDRNSEETKNKDPNGDNKKSDEEDVNRK